MNSYKYQKLGLIILAIIAILLIARPGHVYAADTKVPTEPENGIPLVIVNVDETAKDYGTIKTMNESEDHSVKCTGTIEIKVPAGWKSPYGVSTAPVGELQLDYIRGRGNSTWMCSKKPYKIALKEKADLFGMGASDDWALMASAMDDTLMRNRITSWLGIQMDMPYTPQMIPVDVVMKGKKSSEYLGSYLLSETVKVEDSRVAIGKLKKDVDATTGDPNITGGYLLSFYTEVQNSDEPASTVFSTKNGVDLINKTPDYDNTEGALTPAQEIQRAYIRKEIQDIEDMIMDPRTIDTATHNRIAERLDMKSVADYWWIQEFTKNGDAFGTSSTYLYKERDGKVFFGPLWDFDIAWGVYMESEGLSYDESLCAGFANTTMIWMDELRKKDPAYCALLKQRWKVLDAKLAELVRDGGIIDQYGAEVAASQKTNYIKWSQVALDPEQDEPLAEGDVEYKELLKGFKRWISVRRDWINSHVDRIDKTRVTISFEVEGQIVRTQEIEAEENFYTEFHPRKEGFVFTGWVDKKTGKKVEWTPIYEDITIVATFIPESEAIAPKYLFTWRSDEWASLQQEEFYPGTITLWPEDATDKDLIYAVSDESIAQVTESGTLQLKAVGDVKVTATTYNGISTSFMLHIYDADKTKVKEITGITLKQKSITIEEGSVGRISYDITPKKGPYDYSWVNFEGKDPEVVQTDISGAIMGLKPGITTVTLRANIGGDKVVSKKVKVIVTAKNRAKNTMKASGKTVKLSAAKLGSKDTVISRKKAITLSKAKGTVTYKLVSVNNKKMADKFSVDKKTGKITIKKGLKKGTYKLKIKVKAADSPYYKDMQKEVTVVIKVK